jgi:uncharacterized protein YndB with AHSA1/START domain
MSTIRQQINIAAPTRTVWKALTTEEGLTSWWVDGARIDARPGGRVVLTSEGDDGNPVEERGILHDIRPTRHIEITWDHSSPAVTKGTRVEFSVARDGDETRVSVVHSGKGALEDAAAREKIEKGWKQALLALRQSLE